MSSNAIEIEHVMLHFPKKQGILGWLKNLGKGTKNQFTALNDVSLTIQKRVNPHYFRLFQEFTLRIQEHAKQQAKSPFLQVLALVFLDIKLVKKTLFSTVVFLAMEKRK
jgi:hypothetical protein